MAEGKEETIEEKIETFITRTGKFFTYLKSSQDKHAAEMKDTLEAMKNERMKIEKCMNDIILNLQIVTRNISNVDESLGNVLLAIRQNEFLQAYYPAQHGYPDMKITGKHPVKFHKNEGKND